MEFSSAVLAVREGFLYSMIVERDTERAWEGRTDGKETTKVGRGSRFRKSRSPTWSRFGAILSFASNLPEKRAAVVVSREKVEDTSGAPSE